MSSIYFLRSGHCRPIRMFYSLVCCRGSCSAVITLVVLQWCLSIWLQHHISKLWRKCRVWTTVRPGPGSDTHQRRATTQRLYHLLLILEFQPHGHMSHICQKLSGLRRRGLGPAGTYGRLPRPPAPKHCSLWAGNLRNILEMSGDPLERHANPGEVHFYT